jgi:hypothetical protein
MNLQPRERRTILIGAVIALVVGGYTWVLRPLLSSRGTGDASYQQSQFGAAFARLREYGAVGRDVQSLGEKLNVEVPTGSASDQMKQLVEQFESLSGRAQGKITNIQQVPARGRDRSSQSAQKTDLRMDLTFQNFAGVVRFLYHLERLKVPIVTDHLSVTTSSGRSGGSGRGGSSRSGGGSGKRQIQVSLKVHTYLFPEKAQQ